MASTSENASTTRTSYSGMTIESTKKSRSDVEMSRDPTLSKELDVDEGGALGDKKGVTFRPGDDDYSAAETKSTHRPKLHTEESYRRMVVQKQHHNVFYPWTKWVKVWWGFSVFCSIMTIFFETYQIAFAPAGLAPHDDTASIIGFLFIIVFTLDIGKNFNLAYFDDEENIVYDRPRIAKNYLSGSCMFWVDFIGVFPFYFVALAITGEMGKDSDLSRYLSLLRLLRLVRLYRVKQLFDTLQYNSSVSLVTLTMTRNFGAVLVWTHFAACVMYFIARQYHYDDDSTWIGGKVYGQNSYERYITALYWSVVTFTTVGYGDFSPVNVAEQMFGMIYMLVNMVIAAWMIGSISLLIVKNDEETGEYRDTLQTLNDYSIVNGFDRPFRKRLRKQIKLYFKGRELADEHVLKDFPSSMRRRVLKRLYLPTLYKTHLMKHIRQQFIDSFLTECTVEVFSPGEELLSRGSIATDLYLLVDGVVKLTSMAEAMDNHSKEENTPAYASTFGGSDINECEEQLGVKIVKAGLFINDISFFTETPQTDTIKTMTVCKTLTLNQAKWKLLVQDHPGSVGKILNNLLRKVEKMAEETGGNTTITLTKRLEVLQAGSVYDTNESTYSGFDSEDLSGHGAGSEDPSLRYVEDGERDRHDDLKHTLASVQARTAVVACQDLIRMHINKLKDDHTTRFLFACSRGCTASISLMCDQGFDPNSADYDNRCGIMIAAQQGCTDAVKKLLEYQANPNMVDMHGNTALYEAVKNGHDDTMQVLIDGGASLCFDEGRAASTLCQAVFDGDAQTLKRLLQANIQLNAGDYDKRTAVHIAAAEGNLAAMKILVEFGADLSVKDRWKNTVIDEATASNSAQVLEFLNSDAGNK